MINISLISTFLILVMIIYHCREITPKKNIGGGSETCGPFCQGGKCGPFCVQLDQLSAEGAITVAIDGVFGRWEIGVKEDRRGEA